ncbi:hypothetical protein J6G99_03325, partial [bacterium]|nr:hypothetical protein [bacterium]
KKSYDKFSMRVFATGKIQVLDCWAVKAIQVSKDLNNKNSTGNEKDTGAICAELGEPDPEPAVCNVEPSVYTDVCCEDEKWSSSANCQVPEENDCDCSLHPNGPSDDCCDIEKCPHSEWTETAYCGNCYPLDTSSASSCCDTWYANSSIFGNFGSKDEDEKTQACCNVSSFSSSHSSEGDVCYIEPASPDLKQYTATWDIKMSPTLTYNPSFVDSYSITGNFRDDYIVYIHAVYEYSNYPRGYTRGAHVISNNDKETNTFIAYASDTRYTGKDAIFHYTSNTVNAYTDGPYASDYRVESFNDTGSRCIIYIYNKKTEMLTQLYPSDNGYPCHWNSDDDLWHDDDDLYICEHNRFRHCSGTITWTENDY